MNQLSYVKFCTLKDSLEHLHSIKARGTEGYVLLAFQDGDIKQCMEAQSVTPKSEVSIPGLLLDPIL